MEFLKQTNMKKFFLISAFLMAALCTFSQAKKPTIMVIPSDIWCQQHGYMQTFENQGGLVSVPDYKAALRGDMDLQLVIAKINELMLDRGFPLKNLESQLKIIEQQDAEQNLMTSKNGNEVAESPIDRLLRTAKADIVIQVGWEIKTSGPKYILNYVMAGIDSYTGKQIAGGSGVSEPSYTSDAASLLEEAVLIRIDDFNSRLQTHFDDMFENGREVAFEVHVFANNEAGIDLETEYGDLELGEVIDAWMAKNTVKGRFSKVGGSENYLQYEQVRIPIYDEFGNAIDAEAFARSLRKLLRKAPYNIPCKVVARGMGKGVIYIGEK